MIRISNWRGIRCNVKTRGASGSRRKATHIALIPHPVVIGLEWLSQIVANNAGEDWLGAVDVAGLGNEAIVMSSTILRSVVCEHGTTSCGGVLAQRGQICHGLVHSRESSWCTNLDGR